MFQNKTFLAVIPARAGSKGLVDKNIKPFCGKPLIQWSIEAAQQSRYLDKIIVSTDSLEIKALAEQAKAEVPFIRPAHLATDEASSMDVMLHCLESLPTQYDYFVMLQATSPLRECQDIDNAIEYCINNNTDFCVSVTSPDKHPFWHFKLSEQGTLIPLIENMPMRRQDLPEVYCLNGAIYIAKVSSFLTQKTFFTKTTMPFFMPKARSFDIDTILDFEICQFLKIKSGEKQ